MIEKPHLIFGKVMHKRLKPRINAFSYGIYYLALPLSYLNSLPIAFNRFGLLSFYNKDHGARDGSDLEAWMRDILAREKITTAGGAIVLVTMPRVLGYVFNPVSFWLCHDQAGGLRAVLCEVNNTFGESHNYLCVRPDQAVLSPEDWLQGDKQFHVSPFLARDGFYRFRFHGNTKIFAAWIDHESAEGQKRLFTSLHGRMAAMTKGNLRKAFWLYPLMTFQAIILIHWQAIKLVWRQARYRPKPVPYEIRLTRVDHLHG